MYKVFKPAGYNASVSVENMDTMSSVIIGRLSMEILNLLETAGHKIENYTEEINIEVDKEVANELSRLAMKMKKPIRDQRKKTPTVKAADKDVDAFDLIFGGI